jgi:hypothetical protein
VAVAHGVTWHLIDTDPSFLSGQIPTVINIPGAVAAL